MFGLQACPKTGKHCKGKEFTASKNEAGILPLTCFDVLAKFIYYIKSTWCCKYDIKLFGLQNKKLVHGHGPEKRPRRS
jgi:hypothetical protein